MRHLARRPVPPASSAPAGSLAVALATVPEPRQPYGWRPQYPPLPLVGLLQVTVAATQCGMRSLDAIARWAKQRSEDDPALLEALGLPAGRYPCVATLHRVFKVLDVSAFEAALGRWLLETGVAPTDPVAVDGKTLRGIHGEGVPGVDLVGVYAHRAGAILAQLRTAAKGQELAAAKAVVAQVPLSGRLVTAAALLRQREVAEQILGSGGADLLPVKANQPSLDADLETAFSPLGADRAGGVRPSGHPGLVASGRARAGRREVRMVWLIADPALNAYVGSSGSVGKPWPGLQQVARVERQRLQVRQGRVVKTEREGTDAITARSPDRADAAAVLAALRGHWGIENRAHWVRDVSFDEDRCQVRSGAAPQVLAAGRNLASALLRRAGQTNIADGLRRRAGRPAQAIRFVLAAGSLG